MLHKMYEVVATKEQAVDVYTAVVEQKTKVMALSFFLKTIKAKLEPSTSESRKRKIAIEDIKAPPRHMDEDETLQYTLQSRAVPINHKQDITLQWSTLATDTKDKLEPFVEHKVRTGYVTEPIVYVRPQKMLTLPMTTIPNNIDAQIDICLAIGFCHQKAHKQLQKYQTQLVEELSQKKESVVGSTYANGQIKIQKGRTKPTTVTVWLDVDAAKRALGKEEWLSLVRSGKFGIDC